MTSNEKDAVIVSGSITVNNGKLNTSGRIYSIKKDITINGGTVTVTSGTYGLYSANKAININGGKVTDNSGQGISAYNDITLGWINYDDFFKTTKLSRACW